MCVHKGNNSLHLVLYITITISCCVRYGIRLHVQLNYRFMNKWNRSNINIGLNLNIAFTDMILNKGSSPLDFFSLNLVNSETIQWKLLRLRLNFLVSSRFKTETFRNCKLSKVTRRRLQTIIMDT